MKDEGSVLEIGGSYLINGLGFCRWSCRSLETPAQRFSQKWRGVERFWDHWFWGRSESNRFELQRFFRTGPWKITELFFSVEFGDNYHSRHFFCGVYSRINHGRVVVVVLNRKSLSAVCESSRERAHLSRRGLHSFFFSYLSNKSFPLIKKSRKKKRKIEGGVWSLCVSMCLCV